LDNSGAHPIQAERRLEWATRFGCAFGAALGEPQILRFALRTPLQDDNSDVWMTFVIQNGICYGWSDAPSARLLSKPQILRYALRASLQDDNF
jgi:hypothetical protein